MTSPKLKPCPSCGASVRITGGDEWHNQHEFWICCENKECGCVRVGDTEREECIRRWNDLPRALTWATTPPTDPGFYWLQREGESSVVYVTTDEFDLPVVFCLGDEFGEDLYKIDDAYWAGPIPEPQGD